MRFEIAVLLLLATAVACEESHNHCEDPNAPLCKPVKDGGVDGTMDSSQPDGGETVGCNPVGDGTDCLLPFPSDVFLVTDESTPSGKAVRLSEEALLTWDTDTFDPARLFQPDGFSAGSQIIFGFDEAADEQQMVNRFDDFAVTLSTDSPTLLIDASTGELIAHFAETDARDKTANPINFIRPASRLAYETRYIVVVHGLNRAAGGLMPATKGFAAVRDKEEGVSPSLQAHYDEDIFPVIETVGVARSDVQLAWDFTTGSADSVKGRLLAIRDAMRGWLAENDPKVTITSVADHESEHIATRVEGTIEVPAFVDSADPGARLLPRLLQSPDLSKTFEVPFWVNIPQSVAEGKLPGRALQFGHGFFGTHEEIDSAYHTEFANQYGLIHFAVEWWGMSSPDQESVITAIMNDSSDLAAFVERVHQAMANQLALTQAIKTTLASHEALQVDGSPIYDSEHVYFYGISQGSILGATLLSISDDLHHSALNVGGANFSLIMSRSASFAPFLAIISLEAKTSRRTQELASMTQLGLDLVDPQTYFEEFKERMSAEKPLVVAFQGGLGDISVPNISLEFQMRSLGVPTLAPVEYSYYEQEVVESPAEGSALTLFDFGTDPLPNARAEATTTVTPAHGETRRVQAAQEQIDRLFTPDGKVEATCDGVCDPE